MNNRTYILGGVLPERRTGTNNLSSKTSERRSEV